MSYSSTKTDVGNIIVASVPAAITQREVVLHVKKLATDTLTPIKDVLDQSADNTDDLNTRLVAVEADYLDSSNIVNVLNSTSTTNALSANQGKALNDRLVAAETTLDAVNLSNVDLDTLPEIVTYVENLQTAVGGLIVDNLTSTDAAKALSAAQGKVLKDAQDAIDERLSIAEDDITAIDADYLKSTDILNVLNSTSTIDALSANQGKVINDRLVTVEGDYLTSADAVTVVNVLNSTSTTDALSAAQGKALQDNKVNTSAIINDLTTGGTAVPLSAQQGVALKALIDGITSITVENSLTSTSTTNALSAAKGKDLNDRLALIEGKYVSLSDEDVININTTTDLRYEYLGLNEIALSITNAGSLSADKSLFFKNELGGKITLDDGTDPLDIYGWYNGSLVLDNSNGYVYPGQFKLTYDFSESKFVVS